MELNTILSNQGFSSEELLEMQPMTSSVALFFSEKDPSINWAQVAIFEADFLSQFAKSDKVRNFAIAVENKIKKFS